MVRFPGGLARLAEARHASMPVPSGCASDALSGVVENSLANDSVLITIFKEQKEKALSAHEEEKRKYTKELRDAAARLVDEAQHGP